MNEHSEKAIFPTEDEREALGRILDSWAGPWMDGQRPALYDLLVSAGFRRSEEPIAPHDEHHDDELTRERYHHGIDPETSAEPTCKNGTRLTYQCADCPSEAQGEPSDAAVTEAVHAIGLRGFHVTSAAMRAALRADGGVR